ncbi:MAG: hypothetical protein VKP57_08780 [Candidatus Sericytochromatia bacterium]|nr:hypothetical protein [Candidatus Sericytochromatia bacterium]
MKRIALLPAALLLASCAATTVGTQVMMGKTRTASIVGYDPLHTRLFVTFAKRDGQGTRTVQQLPTSYASASVVLSNAALLASSLTRSITFASTNSSELVVANTTSFTRLRTGSGYELNVSLQDGASAEVGRGRRTGITLTPGTNTVSIIISPNGDLAITGSNQGNNVGNNTGWFVTKGDTVTFDTGFASDEHTKFLTDNPGATLSMQVLINDGAADDLTQAGSGASEQIVATVSAPFDSFVWDTSTTSNTGFNPTTGLTDTGSQASRMKFQIVDSNGNVLGESILSPLSVGGAAAIDLKLQ